MILCLNWRSSFRLERSETEKSLKVVIIYFRRFLEYAQNDDLLKFRYYITRP